MFRLRSSILAHILSSPATSRVPSPHRLISAAVDAPSISPSPGFNVEEYLVERCGLIRDQALKASGKISHLKSPTNPDAVLAFLAGIGHSTADIAAAVARDPKLLCTGVDRTLAPVVTGLTSLGLSRDEIARLASLAPDRFRCRSIVSNLQYYLPIFGSFENLLRAVKYNTSLLTCSLERTVKPNVAVLRECGLGDCEIAKLSIVVPWMLSNNPERVRSIVACADGLGVPRSSLMFKHALHAVASLSEEKIAAKVEYLKNTFRWSDAEVSIAISKLPYLLIRSQHMLRSRSEFLITEVGLEPASIVHRTALFTCSLEGRLRPRYYVMKFLKENGLLKRDPSYDTVVKLTDKAFMAKFICPHNEATPHLAEDYATACRGEVPISFRFK